MDFFRFISREKVICKRDAVPVHKQSHFDNGIWTVVFFRSTLSVLRLSFVSFLIDRISVFVQCINIWTSDIKVIIRTVEIRNRQIPFTDAP